MIKYNQIPECRAYHPSSELNGRSGYYPNIDSKQLAAVNELIHIIDTEKILFNIDEEHEFLKLLRFLRARQFNVQKSLHMIKEDLNWRLEENRNNLRNETAFDVLKCDLHKLYQYFPTWIQGYDKQLRPVSYRQFGKFEIWKVLEITTMQQLIKFHAWETEQALKKMHLISKDSGYNIETFVIVVDAKGWNMKLATNDAFAFIKGMASTDSDHYPERLGSLILINAPSVLSVSWKIVQGFLDAVTKKKIKILSSNQKEWQKVLLEIIDIDQIPLQYGGNAPNPTPENALEHNTNNN
jgi:hypothetical protein